MRGSIRAGVGFFCVFGSVGSLDADPNASLLVAISLAVVGLVLMYSGVMAMNRGMR